MDERRVGLGARRVASEGVFRRALSQPAPPPWLSLSTCRPPPTLPPSPSSRLGFTWNVFAPDTGRAVGSHRGNTFGGAAASRGCEPTASPPSVPPVPWVARWRGFGAALEASASRENGPPPALAMPPPDAPCGGCCGGSCGADTGADADGGAATAPEASEPADDASEGGACAG